jgi:hypothetical protein
MQSKMSHGMAGRAGVILPGLLCAIFLASGQARAQSGPTTREYGLTHLRGAVDDALRNAIQHAPKAEQWPDQDYAVLLDLADVTVKSDGTVVSRYRQTYKIFNSRARDLGEIDLSYNESYQSLRVLHARTIQEDGTVLDVRPSDIRRTAQFNDYLLYDDVKGVGFSLPGVKANCIIDCSWEEVTRPLLMPGQFWLAWTFSGVSPVECSRLTLHCPSAKPFHVALRNMDGCSPSTTSTEHAGTITTMWEARQLKPIVKEPMMPDWDNVTARIEITSLSSWQEIARWYWDLQKPQTTLSPALKTMVAQLTGKSTTADEKTRAIYDWVSRSVRYVGLEFGLSAYKPHPAAEVHAKLYGDCKDKATLLIAMLGEAGIKAYPTLLQTETRNLLEQKLPALDAFDHCIAIADVDGKEVWLDATAETCPYGDIPDEDRGVQALVVRNGIGELKTIPELPPGASGQDATLHIDLQPDGSARISAELTWRGRDRQQWQDAIGTVSPARREKLMRNFAAALSTDATLVKWTCSDPEHDHQVLTLSLECLAPHWAKRVGDLLLLPVANSLLTPKMQTFAEDTRVWPIVTSDSLSVRSTIVIGLPANTIVEGVPQNATSTGPYQTFERRFDRSTDGRTLTITQSYRESPVTVPPRKYAELKAYCAALAAGEEDRVVLHVGH